MPRSASLPGLADDEAEVTAKDRPTVNGFRAALAAQRVGAGIAFGQAMSVEQIVAHNLHLPAAVARRDARADRATSSISNQVEIAPK